MAIAATIAGMMPALTAEQFIVSGVRLIVHENNLTGGLGGEIAAVIAQGKRGEIRHRAEIGSVLSVMVLRDSSRRVSRRSDAHVSRITHHGAVSHVHPSDHAPAR